MLNLPPVADDGKARQEPCAICGATVVRGSRHERRCANGSISMTVDNDLCLECAVHLWRAIKHVYGPGSVRLCHDLLRAYPVTALFIPPPVVGEVQ